MREGHVSDTALQIARALVYFGAHDGTRELLPEGAASATRAILTGAGLYRSWHRWIHRRSAYRLGLSLTDRVVGGGAFVHFPLRKRFVDDQVEEAFAAGCHQLLVIGAGFDTVAPRFVRRHKRCLAVEIDHPATSAAKERGLRAAGLTSAYLEQVPIDLAAHPLSEALGATRWKTDVASVVVAEGLLMYLPKASVEALFRAIHEQSGPGTRVVFTWIPELQGKIALDRLTRTVIAAVGEPIRFTMEADAMASFLEGLGWRLLPAVDLHSRYLKGTALAASGVTAMERLSVAERI